MTRIACLGWGSLVWDPRELPVRGQWFQDGPLVPVEFLRQSKEDQITLVLHEGTAPVRSLWADIDCDNVDQAHETLRCREGRTAKKWIGVWRQGEISPVLIPGLSDWANGKGLQAVLWTALPPKFRGENGVAPSCDEVIEHLKQLVGEKRENAERYIRNAPSQIRTQYRSRIESTLGWGAS